MGDLYAVFNSFAGFADRGAGANLDSFKFAKLTRDCGLLDARATPTQVDLIFTRAKALGARKINFDEFRTALAMIADLSYPGDPDGPRRVEEAVIRAGGPSTGSASKPATSGSIFEKLTDTSLYTGAHKLRFDSDGRGLGIAGRDSVAVGTGTAGQHHGPISDLSQITRETMRGGTLLSSASATRRVGGSHSPTASGRAPGGMSATNSASSPSMPTYGGGTARTTPRGETPRQAAAAAAAASVVGATAAVGAGGGAGGAGGGLDLHQVFVAFSCFGATSSSGDELDGARFAKMIKEAGLLDKHFGAPAVDIAFSKAKTKGRRTINYEQFKQALALIALEKYSGEEPTAAVQRVLDAILAAGGPSTGSAAKPSTSGSIFEKLTDTNLYTGAHKLRFDADGRGRGIAGRDSVAVGTAPGKFRGEGRVQDLSQLVRPNLH